MSSLNKAVSWSGPALTADLVHALTQSSQHPHKPGNMTAHFTDE